MIKLQLKNNIKKCFNLKNFDTEKRLQAAWYSMSGDLKFENKKLKITTDIGEELFLPINDILDCVFDESTYVKAEVHLKKEEKPDLSEQLNNSIKAEEDRKVNLLFNELRKKGVIINPMDPMLQKIIKDVKNDLSDSKIPFYANLYATLYKKI